MFRLLFFWYILVLSLWLLTENEVHGFTTRRNGLSVTRRRLGIDRSNGYRRQPPRQVGDWLFPLFRGRVVVPVVANKNNKNDDDNDTTTTTTTTTVNPDFFIRPSLAADVGRASQILTEGFFKHKTNFLVYQWERLETYLSLDSTFPKPNTLHQIFVACDSRSGRVLGMVELDARVPKTKDKKDKDDKSTGSAVSPYMCNVAVDEKHQRRGIASALIARCERQVEEWYEQTQGKISCSLYLRVRESNIAAVSMYTKLNYTSFTQEAGKKTGEKLLVMRKELQRRSKPNNQVEQEVLDTPVTLSKMVNVTNP